MVGTSARAGLFTPSQSEKLGPWALIGGAVAISPRRAGRSMARRSGVRADLLGVCVDRGLPPGRTTASRSRPHARRHHRPPGARGRRAVRPTGESRAGPGRGRLRPDLHRRGCGLAADGADPDPERGRPDGQLPPAPAPRRGRDGRGVDRGTPSAGLPGRDQADPERGPGAGGQLAGPRRRDALPQGGRGHRASAVAAHRAAVRLRDRSRPTLVLRDGAARGRGPVGAGEPLRTGAPRPRGVDPAPGLPVAGRSPRAGPGAPRHQAFQRAPRPAGQAGRLREGARLRAGDRQPRGLQRAPRNPGLPQSGGLQGRAGRPPGPTCTPSAAWRSGCSADSCCSRAASKRSCADMPARNPTSTRPWPSTRSRTRCGPCCSPAWPRTRRTGRPRRWTCTTGSAGATRAPGARTTHGSGGAPTSRSPHRRPEIWKAGTLIRRWGLGAGLERARGGRL